MSNRNFCLMNIGPSKFFLHQTAQSIPPEIMEVETISGLVPDSSRVVSRFAQQHMKSGKRVEGRVDTSNDLVVRHEIVLGEIAWQLGTYFGKYRRLQRSSKYFYTMSLALFDFGGIRILKRHRKRDSLIYYVRSGCGNKSIPYAISLGFKVIVDHSYPHPLFDFLNNVVLDTKSLHPFSIEKRMLNDLDASNNIIVNSEYVRSTFIKIGDHRELQVLLPPIDPKFAQLLHENKGNDREGIIYFGLADRRKGIDKFAEVIDLLPSSVPTQVVGNLDPKFDHIRKSLSLKPNVQIHPHAGVGELVKLLTSARYFLFLTQGEGSARTVGEAMHAGVIVLTTQEAGMPFNKDALIDVTNRSAPEICDMIKNLENDINLRSKISGKAIDYIAKLEEKYLPNLIKYCNSI